MARIPVLAAILLAFTMPTRATAGAAPLSPERRAQVEALLSQRIVLLAGAIDDDCAATAIAQLLFLESQGSGEIALVIDSAGGPLANGMALRDTLRGLKATVATYCADRCGGVAAIVLAAGAKGRRHVSPRSRVELRDVSGQQGGSAEALARNRQKVIGVVSSLTGQSAARVDRDLRAGLSFTAEQALRYGFADTASPPPSGGIVR